MLINSLSVKNFRKYHQLEVTDIPKNGVITIAGSNESGKTSIGEAICFALFGRTFFLDQNNLHKIICWGRDTTEVTLRFSVAPDEHYSISRTLDRDGTNTVSLRKEVTEGISDISQIDLDTEDKVDTALTKILGFDYDAFANSFYLVQRELTAPDPNSHTVKQMAGIADYSNITDDLRESIQVHQKKITEITPDVITTEKDLNAIDLDETWLPELVDAELTLGEEQQRREALMGHLDTNGSEYADNIKTYHRIRRARSFWSFLSIIIFPVAVVSWVLWGVHKLRPKIFEDSAINLFGLDELPRILEQTNMFLLPIVIISTSIFFISLLLKNKASSKISTLNQEAGQMSMTMREGHRFITTQVETLLPERIVQLFNERRKDESTLLIIPPREQFSNLSQIIEDMPSYSANAEEVNGAIKSLSSSLGSQDIEIIDLARSLIDDVEQERFRSDDAGKLRSTLKVLNRAVDGHQREIDVSNISTGMLQRAASDSIQLFNKNISDTSAKALPNFTEGRYSEIRIADNLNVQVYSDEKKGYMDFDEISSGTQRQIMLALRIAMSEELSKNTGNEQQFIFLDEPFAFFDQARTNSTLTSLPNVSDVISQIWIVAQEFPEDVKVEKAINCPEDSAELLV